jgi:hypothetical protein
LKPYLILVLLCLLLGCKQSSESTVNELVDEFDTLKSIELIRQVLDNEQKDYFFSSCVVEEAIPMYVSTNSDLLKEVTEKLGVSDTTHLKEQIMLYEQFKLTPDLVPGKTILTKQHFRAFEKKKPIGKSSWVMIESTCEDGYSFILKPIFNEDYTLALVQFGINCGSYCGGGETQVYEYKDGKWIKIRTVGAWVE